jgi:hypothetical protein
MERPKISDSFAVCQTIIISAGHGVKLSKTGMDKLKNYMQSHSLFALKTAGFEAIRFGDQITVRKAV